MNPLSRLAHRAGFTFLEVLVSLAILAMVLTALGGITANSFGASNYSKFLTITTLLARSKMIEIEEELRDDGFGDDEKEYDGDFSEEGFPGIKWVAVCRPIEVDVSQLVYGLMGLGGEQGINPDELSENIQGMLAAKNGIDANELDSETAGSGLGEALAGGALEQIFKGIGETLKDSIREITLEVKWKEGEKFEESVKFVQYVTTTGRLSLPQGAPPRLQNPNAPGQRNANTLQGTIGGQQGAAPAGGGGSTIQIGGGASKRATGGKP